jgi:hypothetical protein
LQQKEGLAVRKAATLFFETERLRVAYLRNIEVAQVGDAC